MKLSAAQGLIFVAAIMNGILVGGGLDRALVTFPAWRAIGSVAWATFSRHADLGNGRLWYPLWGFAGMICSVAAAVVVYWFSEAPLAARSAVDGALFTIGGLLITLKAAPIMLSLSRLGDDPLVLQQALDGFAFWSYIRLVFQVLGWLATCTR